MTHCVCDRGILTAMANLRPTSAFEHTTYSNDQTLSGFSELVHGIGAATLVSPGNGREFSQM